MNVRDLIEMLGSELWETEVLNAGCYATDSYAIRP